ncbi:PST family polysaccharide transporter [Labedella gwakjiensis]|uniref:Lipopolysaccharide biosynthesis protein n=1 Tax=Labedella gwakjiensis TaxID=390269 RepID=A0A2P8GSG5_9MICO|nr:lipopolysaccharide biosynthesis protein [Labedella gwakjiensis]PSL36897.1 PST family polysaccharide transporter [Labedella gwakjiensis]RUQ84392.1 lipopolysaccharide biosynthesis protein [Labedella gwakjiensis]
MSTKAPTASSNGDFGRNAARGAAVTMGGQLVRILIQFVSVVVLSRLLSPDEYGLFTMVMVIVGVSEVFRDFGLSNAAIQAPSLSSRQRDVLFWANAGIGVALGVILFGVAYLIGALYGRPELIPLAQFMALTFVLNGIATQHRASLSRDLRFGALALIDVVASVGALAIAIVLAVSGASYWSLAWQMVSLALISLVLVMAASRWLPRLPRRGTDMTGFYRFGWNMVSTQLIGYAASNTDSLVLGLRFGPGPLGVYSRGFQLLMNPLNQLRAPITRVAIPVLSRMQAEHERLRFNSYVTRGQIALGYTLVAGLALVAGAAQPLVDVFLGPKWGEVPPVLRLLAVAGAFQTLALVGYWVYVSRGLTGHLFRFTLMSAGMKITFVLIGSQWGIVGVAAGFALEPVLSWPLSLWWLNRATPIPIRTLLVGVVRISAAAIIAGAAAFGATVLAAPAGAVVQILAAVVAEVMAYGLLALIVRPIRRDVLVLLEIVRTARRSKTTPPIEPGDAGPADDGSTL